MIVADSTSVNLFKLIVAAAALAPGRRQLLSEAGNFHTDLHIAAGAAELAGLRLDVVDRESIDPAIGADTNLLLLTHVHYKAGSRFDMAQVTARAKAAGALTLWDLSHSAGAVPLDLNRDGAELAVGCGYKYLNGGPGAPAFLYVAEALQERLMPPLRGWMGHAEPFAFTDDYRPAPGIDRFLVGTPPMLSLGALESGVESFEGVGYGVALGQVDRLVRSLRRSRPGPLPRARPASRRATPKGAEAISASATPTPSSSARR